MTVANWALKQEIARVEQLRKENKKPFYTVDEAAETLGVNPSDVLELIETKQLAAYPMLGNVRIIPNSVFDYWIASIKGKFVKKSGERKGWSDEARAAASERLKARHGDDPGWTRRDVKAKQEARLEPTVTIVARVGDPPPIKPYPPDAPQPPFVKVATIQSDRAAFVRPPVEPLHPAVPEHILRLRELGVRLKREFPLALANPPNVRPPALDIYTQACKALPKTDAGDLLRVITYFQNGSAYLSAMVRPGARRYNLDGTDAGPVLAFHAKEAREKLQEIIYRREQERQ
jgi:excisionase family DNA binding protein